MLAAKAAAPGLKQTRLMPTFGGWGREGEEEGRRVCLGRRERRGVFLEEGEGRGVWGGERGGFLFGRGREGGGLFGREVRGFWEDGEVWWEGRRGVGEGLGEGRGWEREGVGGRGWAGGGFWGVGEGEICFFGRREDLWGSGRRWGGEWGCSLVLGPSDPRTGRGRGEGHTA